MISLRGRGYEEQRKLLESEGIVFDGNDRIDLKRFQWQDDSL
jgi:alkylated DNA nucleotide flippase Atl1